MCHLWFTRGQRPSGSCDQRYSRARLSAALWPIIGDGFALVLPHGSTDTVQAFLARFAATLARDEHETMIVDGAG